MILLFFFFAKSHEDMALASSPVTLSGYCCRMIPGSLWGNGEMGKWGNEGEDPALHALLLLSLWEKMEGDWPILY